MSQALLEWVVAISLCAGLGVPDARAGDAVAHYVAAMNAERQRCRVPPLILDPRLQQVAEARLQQLYRFGFSHTLPDGSDPRPSLCRQFGVPQRGVASYRGVWLDSTSEGIMMGSFGPAALGIPSEQYPYEPAWSRGRITHHNDLICPKWNRVGHAFGRYRGVAYSVSVYGDAR